MRNGPRSIDAELKNLILSELSAFSVNKIGLFGSYARRDQTEHSDIDILVSFREAPSLLQLVGLQNALSEAIGKNVDLVSEGSLKNSRFKNSVMKDLIVIYDA